MERSIGETVSAISRQKMLLEAKDKAAKGKGEYDVTGKSVMALKVEMLSLMLAGERVSDAMRRSAIAVYLSSIVVVLLIQCCFLLRFKGGTVSQNRQGSVRSKDGAVKKTSAANKTELNMYVCEHRRLIMYF